MVEHAFGDICTDPACTVCELFQRDGEDRAVWLARVRAQWRGDHQPPSAVEPQMTDEDRAEARGSSDALTDQVTAKLAALEGEERDTLKALRAAQERLIAVRGGIAALKEVVGAAAPKRPASQHPAPLTESPVLSGKRWSRQHDACQSGECHTPEKPHFAKGLCQTCYARLYQRENPRQEQREREIA